MDRAYSPVWIADEPTRNLVRKVEISIKCNRHRVSDISRVVSAGIRKNWEKVVLRRHQRPNEKREDRDASSHPEGQVRGSGCPAETIRRTPQRYPDPDAQEFPYVTLAAGTESRIYFGISLPKGLVEAATFCLNPVAARSIRGWRE